MKAIFVAALLLPVLLAVPTSAQNNNKCDCHGSKQSMAFWTCRCKCISDAGATCEAKHTRKDGFFCRCR